MNIEVDNSKIAAPLIERLHTVVKQNHNLVEARMTNMNRRVLKNLFDALEQSSFEKRGLQIGWRYFLADGTIAERINNELALYRLADVQRVPVRTHVQPLPGVFTDLPAMEVKVGRRQQIDPDSQPVMAVVRRQFLCRYSYVNDRGYEYIVSVSTPGAAAGAAQTLADTERDLLENQVNDFSIRFVLADYNHSTFFHVLNSINLLIQCFHPSLQLSVSL
jgi:hypothetical protein